MIEEREGAEQKEEREETPFDENPPVDPTGEQVGNSRARFFMPSEGESEEEGSEEEDER